MEPIFKISGISIIVINYNNISNEIFEAIFAEVKNTISIAFSYIGEELIKDSDPFCKKLHPYFVKIHLPPNDIGFDSIKSGKQLLILAEKFIINYIIRSDISSNNFINSDISITNSNVKSTLFSSIQHFSSISNYNKIIKVLLLIQIIIIIEKKFFPLSTENTILLILIELFIPDSLLYAIEIKKYYYDAKQAYLDHIMKMSEDTESIDSKIIYEYKNNLNKYDLLYSTQTIAFVNCCVLAINEATAIVVEAKLPYNSFEAQFLEKCSKKVEFIKEYTNKNYQLAILENSLN